MIDLCEGLHGTQMEKQLQLVHLTTQLLFGGWDRMESFSTRLD